jgi:photosystem II stability/assembly factor-like uncharacterized protein
MKYIYSLLLLIVTYTLSGQTYDSSYFTNLRWRMIGPHRGGRTVGAVGVPSQPNVFYIGVNNGGVWNTTDFGRTWNPLFDKEATGSIGDVVVSPSNPDVIYVGTGEGLHRPDLAEGNGMYRSSDAGKTWTHLGLDDAMQIGGLAIDPKNENRLFVAALGHPYGPNTERGVFRTTDGGKTWDKVLYKDENTGAIQVAIDPVNSNIVYAYMWESRLAPWENGEWKGKGSGLFKSIDGGTTWKQLTKGLPTTEQGLSRIGFTIAPSDPNRLYATVEQGDSGGIYRSNDAGETWIKMSSDERYWGRGDDFAEVKVDPKNADIVYTADVVVWKSTDGAKTFTAFKGAPGGDDYHRLWINPNNSDIILIASDQGAVVTVNGGQTFSSWYNQPTAQFYHVATDNAFPYNVYGAQQESGSVGIVSRSNDGQITFHDWHPVAAEEWGYIAPDPLNPDIIYGGKISRFDKKTGQSQNISPEIGRKGNYRFIRTAPIVFSPVDKKTLYYAGNVLFKTLNGGKSWDIISPDLTRESWGIPYNVGIYKSQAKVTRRGVIYTVAPSPKDINTIWCGTDDGLIWITKDGGKNWKNITPHSVTPWSKVSMLEASHFDVNTCYAAINKIRLDDKYPHILKTTDGGKTWKEIVEGLPNDPINTVREDHIQKGLLFCGSERMVSVSFDNGDNWQPLRLNMPATSIRDLVIKDNDIVVGTHGRSFWILDDINSLRDFSGQIKLMRVEKNVAGIRPWLYSTASAYRVRWNMWSDTPLPPDEPAGENPPDGAIIDYYLGQNADFVNLQIFDTHHNLVCSFSSKDSLYKIPDVNIPLYWIRPQDILSKDQGAHRFLWDMHYQPLNVPPSYPISAIYQNTAPAPTSPWVMPGEYIVRLIVDGKAIGDQTITIKMDPRVKTSTLDLQRQHDLSMIVYNKRKQILSALDEIAKLKEKLNALGKKDSIKELEFVEQGSQDAKQTGFSTLSGTYGYMLSLLEGSDSPPTDTIVNAINNANLTFDKLWKSWSELKAKISLSIGH